jgi:MoxR-like ATPase
MEDQNQAPNNPKSGDEKKPIEQQKKLDDSKSENVVETDADKLLHDSGIQNRRLTSISNDDLQKLRNDIDKVRTEISKMIIGLEKEIDLLMVALFTGGHVLLEGVPGIAKTMLAKLLARTINTGFSRIQFTPDLMPADVIGTAVFNMKTSQFDFQKGPVFSNIVLIDEINRAPAKTQAALIEVMEEKQITVDGITHKMELPFLILATQNPIEQEGTYQLPEAQLDRFLFRIRLNYPELADEKLILDRYQSDFNQDFDKVATVLHPKDVRQVFELIEQVYIKKEVLDYIADITVSTRNSHHVYLGASPRASLWLLKVSKAYAAVNGRDFVTPDDVKFLAPFVLNHRIILSHEKELEGASPEKVIEELIETIEVPR